MKSWLHEGFVWIRNPNLPRGLSLSWILAGVQLAAGVPFALEASVRCANWSRSAQPIKVTSFLALGTSVATPQTKLAKGSSESSLWMTSGVKPELIVRATQDPELFPLLKALHGVDQFLKAVEPGFLSTLKQEFSDRNIEKLLEVDFDLNLFYPMREIPWNFVEKASRQLELDRDLIAKVYPSLSMRFSQEQMSDEALVFLSHAMGEKYLSPIGRVRLASGSRPSPEAMAAHMDAKLSLLQSFFRLRKQQAQLPQFNEFLARNPRLMLKAFIMMVEIVVSEFPKGVKTLESSRLEHTLKEFHLDFAAQESVLGNLLSSPATTFEKKTRILLSAFDENTQNYLRQKKVWKFFAATSKEQPSLEKWTILGTAMLAEVLDGFAASLVHQLQDVVRDMKAAEKKFGSGDLQLRLESIVDYAPDSQFVIDAFRFLNERIDHLDPNGSVRVREAAEKRVASLGRQLSAVLERAEKEELEAQRQARGNGPLITSYQVKTKKGPRHVAIRLRDASSRSEASEPALAAVPESSLTEAVLKEHLDNLDPQRMYQFQMGESLERETPSEKKWQLMNIGSAVARELQSHGDSIDSWIRAFVKGPAARLGDSGLIKIASARSAQIWEIKVRGSEFRIILRQDKERNLWQWLAMVHHDDVQSYVKRHKL